MTAIQTEGEQIVAGTCQGCGYDLTGLRVGQRCPECGAPTAVAAAKRRDRELPMTDAPVAYLRVLALALRFMVLGAVMYVFAGMGGVFGLSRVAAGMIGIGSLVIWIGGVWFVTRPRPKLNRVTGGNEEWATLRLISRGTQFALPVAAAAGVIAGLAGGGFLGFVFGLIATIGVAVAGAGFVPIGIYISFLADWSSDDSTSAHLRVATWLMAVATALAVIARIFGLVGLVPDDPVRVFQLFMGMVLAVAVIWFVFQLWSFAGSVGWAIRNKAMQEERDFRRAERDDARREAERQRIAEEIESYAAPPPVQAALLDSDASGDIEPADLDDAADPPDLDPYGLEGEDTRQ